MREEEVERATRRVFSWFLLAILMGCSAGSPSNSVRRPPEGRTTYELNDLSLTFVSMRTGKRIELLISLFASHHVNTTSPVESAADKAKRQTIQDAISMRDSEAFKWMMFYVTDVALKSLNDGTSPPPGITIKVQGEPTSSRDGAWWATSYEGCSYDRNTFDVRSHSGTSKLTKLFEDDSKMERNWIPLTPETYGVWWRGLNAKRPLGDVFEGLGDH